MDSDRFARINEHLVAVLDMREDERNAYLDLNCTDEEMRREVEAKLSRTVGAMADRVFDGVQRIADEVLGGAPELSGLFGSRYCLAVMDLDNLTGSRDEDWVGPGVAESLCADLADVPGLNLVPRQRIRGAMDDSGTDGACVDAAALGRSLGCQWVLAGGYRIAGPCLGMEVRLVDVEHDQELWVEAASGDLTNLFDVQDALAARVSSRMHRQMNCSEPGHCGDQAGDEPDE